MQVTIARQLSLDPSTVSNFFMNARRRSVDKWKDDRADQGDLSEDESVASPSPLALTTPPLRGHSQYQDQVSIKATPTHNAVLVTSANPAAVVQHLQQPGEGMTPTAALDLWQPQEDNDLSALQKSSRGLSNKQMLTKVTCKTPSTYFSTWSNLWGPWKTVFYLSFIEVFWRFLEPLNPDRILLFWRKKTVTVRKFNSYSISPELNISWSGFLRLKIKSFP